MQFRLQSFFTWHGRANKLTKQVSDLRSELFNLVMRGRELREAVEVADALWQGLQVVVGHILRM